jgi:hypothetical protein
MEISLNVESELFVEFTLLRLTLPFVNIHDVPLLVDSIVLSVDSNVSVLSIDVSNNFEYLSSLIYN